MSFLKEMIFRLDQNVSSQNTYTVKFRWVDITAFQVLYLN